MNIGNPTDIEGGLEEPPLVQPLETPTAAEVEAQLERELQGSGGHMVLHYMYTLRFVHKVFVAHCVAVQRKHTLYKLNNCRQAELTHHQMRACKDTCSVTIVLVFWHLQTSKQGRQLQTALSNNCA